MSELGTPFTLKDTKLMPAPVVGYCKDCAWWSAYRSADGNGWCTLAETFADRAHNLPGHPAYTRREGSLAYAFGEDEYEEGNGGSLQTAPMFGCVQYKPQPPQASEP